jgi:hypothetical protein
LFWVFQTPIRVIIAFFFLFFYFSFIITVFPYSVYLFFVSSKQIRKNRTPPDRLLCIFTPILIQTEPLIYHFLFNSLLYLLAYYLYIRATPLLPTILRLPRPAKRSLIYINLTRVHLLHQLHCFLHLSHNHLLLLLKRIRILRHHHLILIRSPIFNLFLYRFPYLLLDLLPPLSSLELFNQLKLD